MGSNKDDKITLTIGDTGIGMPPGIVPGKSESLGLQLVETLAQQLKGKLTISLDSGTRFEIAFQPQVQPSAL